MSGEISYPYDWQAERDFISTAPESAAFREDPKPQVSSLEEARVPLDISAILFEYFSGEKMKWANRPEAIKGLLGEKAEAIGNLLLNTREPLTLHEVVEQSGLLMPDVKKACSRVTLLMPETGPLELLSVADREMQVTRYQIVFTSPKEPTK